ncbi:MAG: prolipoprotein diacylglyceryl transferase [Armatimonadota bacterium]|nr:prolipoprotein diacylglyceryl transferase [Armatimonadota bacterium]MDR7402515.1 prolipoprotein diacylglyceryl transferase [Armatimonadota bacterium]MDR7403707.1 prolipoprotein diacylglyceryl transferase [Armatimonadota bacterium]MDR7436096.1 prolipoprotein diacylglyceryl transferase [Armatimonadota bacterium]MDR7471975.1 prolipoprotein diacylglyceryl transferase [Armatimonadota bacterium]
MDPVLVQWGPVVIRWYGVMMAVTIVLAVGAALRAGPRVGIPAEEIDRLAVPAIVLAFLGARLGYVLSHPSQFGSLVEVLRVDRGGLTSHGALAGGALGLWWAARRRGLDFWSLADAVVWAVPLGNIFVRLGNFINGELYGDPTTLPWGVTFPGVPQPRHPLQIYEMIWAAAILTLTWPRLGRRRFPGELFWTVIVLTSAGRIVWDLLRSHDRVVWVITLGHIPAAALLGAGVWYLTSRGKGGRGSDGKILKV